MRREQRRLVIYDVVPGSRGRVVDPPPGEETCGPSSYRDEVVAADGVLMSCRGPRSDGRDWERWYVVDAVSGRTSRPVQSAAHFPEYGHWARIGRHWIAGYDCTPRDPHAQGCTWRVYARRQTGRTLTNSEQDALLGRDPRQNQRERNLDSPDLRPVPPMRRRIRFGHRRRGGRYELVLRRPGRRTLVLQRCRRSGCRTWDEQVVGRWAIWSDRDRLYVYDRIRRQRRRWTIPVPAAVRESSSPPLDVFANPESLVTIASQAEDRLGDDQGVPADVYFLRLM